MKLKNKLLAVVLFLIANNSYLFAADEDTVNSVMKFMLVTTVLIIAVVLWLTVVYSERNDNSGSIFLTPLNKLYRWFTKSTPIEKEAEILLKHDFDGIRELDNRIPPWFHFLFYGTIAWAVVYMFVFHVFDDGKIQENEYNTEIQQAAIEKQILIKSGVFINEETVAFVNDAATISEGKELYVKNCLTCHGQNGEGLVGPNLTDDYWVHGGGIKNIFKTIKYGVPDKGMISWQTQLDPKKMQAVSSYIITLHGTNPANAKAPEGEIWKEDSADSSKTI